MIRAKLSNFLYKCIEKIEQFQYRNLDLDPENPDKKVIDILPISDLEINTDAGFQPVSHLYITQPYTIWRIELQNGMYLECADTHIVFDEYHEERYVVDLIIGEKIWTQAGLIPIVKIKKKPFKIGMMDLTVNHPSHRFYSNGILSHNTISSAIAILWYVTFNNDKNVMMIANKYDTVKEILDKIKAIYKQLPFFLKAGVRNWGAKSIVFGDTGCRILTSARTKEPAIGFTIDFLYLDEFAHIPRNVIEPYYRAAFPTVSSIQNSKIVITSTPNGYNLFHKLLVGAENRHNNFHALRVYWYDVKGRAVTYIRLNPHKLEEFDLTAKGVFEYLVLKYNLQGRAKLKWQNENKQYEIHIQQSQDLEIDDVRRMEVSYDAFGGMFEGQRQPININEIGEVTSWKLETIKDIGSEEAFNQEFGLRFLSGSKLMFDEVTLTAISSGRYDFKPRMLEPFNRYPHINYDDLVWVDEQPELFTLNDLKNQYFVLGLDLSEGLGQDFSVININKLMLKPEEIWDEIQIESIYDFFQVEQVGIYRNNLISVKSLAELFYVLCFEVFNDENIKAVLEYNTYGAEFLAHLPKLHQGNNRYGNHVFAKFKHRADAQKPKVGLKVHGNKPTLVKEYQQRVINKFYIPHEEHTIREMSTFIKQETNSGRVSFAAESGHDDIVMTIVGIANVFQNVGFKNLCDQYLEREVPEKTRRKIEEKISGLEYLKGNDYTALFNARRSLQQQQEFNRLVRGWGFQTGG